MFASLLLFKHWECSLGRNGKETDDSKEEGLRNARSSHTDGRMGLPFPPSFPPFEGTFPSMTPSLLSLSLSFLSLSFLSLLPHSLTFLFLSIYLCFSAPQFLRPNPAISRETCIKRKVTDRERKRKERERKEREREKRGTVIERK